MRLALLPVATLLVTAVAVAGSPPDPVQTHLVDTGRAPCGTAVARGGVWVGVYETGELLRLDPANGRVTRRIAVGSWACRVAIDGKAAWVTRDRAGVLVRIDLASGRRQPVDVGKSPFDVLVAAGSVWVTAFEIGIVARLDAATGRVIRVYKTGGSPAGLTRCGRRVWVGHGRGATWLSSIEPATHRLRRFGVGTTSPGWPRCAFGELWVTAPEHLLRIDARTGRVRGRLRLDGTLAEAAAGPDNLVWVTDKERSLVHRVSARKLEVVSSFAAGPGAFSLARSGDAMWVTSFAGSDIRRYTP